MFIPNEILPRNIVDAITKYIQVMIINSIMAGNPAVVSGSSLRGHQMTLRSNEVEHHTFLASES
jgi:hypothetical protein